MTFNRLKKYVSLLFLFLLALSTAVPTFAQEDHCNARLIEALRTRYHLADNLTVAESVYKAACESHGENTSTGVSVLNGGLVGARNIEQNGKGSAKIILNLIPGPNTFQCKIIDLVTCGDGQHCWSYSYTVYYGDDVISQMYDSGHGIAERQPAPLIINYEPKGPRGPAHKSSSKTAKPPDKTP